MVGEVRYIFSDLRSGVVIAEISMQGVRMTSKLNDWGSLNGTYQLDQSGQSNLDLTLASVPGRCGVTAERDGVVLWDGIVWGRLYQSESNTLQISARECEAYLEKSFLRVDKIYEDVEQRNILRDLLVTLQATASQSLRITIPSSFETLVPRTLTVLATEFKNYYQVISSVADGEDGFDWKIETIRTGEGIYTRLLRVGYPVLGGDSGVSIDYPGGAATEYFKSESMTNGGTHMFVLGAGEGSDMIVGEAVHTDMIDTNWMRYDNAISRKDIDNADLATTYAARQNTFRRAPFTTTKIFLKSDVVPVFGSYRLGDTVHLSIKDARHPEGVTSSARLVAWAYRPASDDTVDQAELIFEGDELNDG